MEYYKTIKKKPKKHRKLKIWFVVCLIVLILLIWYTFAIVNPVVVSTSEAKVKSLTQHTLSNAVLSVVAKDDAFNELITYQYDDNKNISLITVSSYQANMMARQISSLAQTQLDNVTATGVEIHIGAFSGISFLASVGPLVRVSLSPIGTVLVSFRSEFVTAGINQTLHKIYINVQSSVYVILPSSNPQIDAKTEVLISESVIVGKIPATYLQSSYLDEMLNLVPV